MANKEQLIEMIKTGDEFNILLVILKKRLSQNWKWAILQMR